METEIRAAFGRFSRASASAAGRGGASRNAPPVGERPSTVRLLPLMSSLRPLLVRDGAVLVRAAANVLRSVELATDGGHDSSGAGSAVTGRNAMVTLASPQHGSGGSGGAGPQSQQQVRCSGVWVGRDVAGRGSVCGVARCRL